MKLDERLCLWYDDGTSAFALEREYKAADRRVRSHAHAHELGNFSLFDDPPQYSPSAERRKPPEYSPKNDIVSRIAESNSECGSASKQTKAERNKRPREKGNP